jgi:hypothetical protein
VSGMFGSCVRVTLTNQAQLLLLSIDRSREFYSRFRISFIFLSIDILLLLLLNSH